MKTGINFETIASQNTRKKIGVIEYGTNNIDKWFEKGI